MDNGLKGLSQAVGQALLERELMLATAESCSGGWVAETVTATAGSSQWFERGFVVYSNVAKAEMLGVSNRTLVTFGAVSEETAAEMAEGALSHSHATIALAVTGIAGPTGGSPGKPVGTVCFAWCGGGQDPKSETQRFSGDREEVRRQSVSHALQGLLEMLSAEN
jgi:nicotinamide-nucleotide amidase